MNKKEAKEITGGLSAPGKMPEGSYNLPASACQTGQKLAKVPGTPCFKCYADNRGRYRFSNVKDAMNRRLESLQDPQWVEAMATLIKGKKHFRWHDSGDLQSVQHLIKIFEVCNLTPETMHWLPTQERRYLPINWRHPKNLVIRLSNAKNDTVPGQAWSHWSTVVTKPRAGHVCPAPEQGNTCGSCRACWSKDVKEVQYKLH
tara:strand:+ start:1309 stop:1914 length:606 start_codon:yes stop_codon:yes gene_type:complete